MSEVKVRKPVRLAKVTYWGTFLELWGWLPKVDLLSHQVTSIIKNAVHLILK